VNRGRSWVTLNPMAAAAGRDGMVSLVVVKRAVGWRWKRMQQAAQPWEWLSINREQPLLQTPLSLMNPEALTLRCDPRPT